MDTSPVAGRLWIGDDWRGAKRVAGNIAVGYAGAMKSTMSVAVVVSISLAAFVLSAQSINAARVGTGTYEESVFGWQTYCPADRTLIHKAEQLSELKEVTRVQVEGTHSHSMFMFSVSGELRLRDLVSGEQWAFNGAAFAPVDEIVCPSYAAYGKTFSHGKGKVEACDAAGCTSVAIAEGTWVYAYASAGGAVLALTNWGGALIYSNGEWCRMRRMDDDVYVCPSDRAEPMRDEPREVQFYTSVKYRGATLVGEWPTGRIYVFDGEKLTPSLNQPPFISAAPVGYEAQSMASYCGDLYVGYWPTGEVWRYSLDDGWSLAAALFPQSSKTLSFIPYADRENPTREPAFYGRRVTALVPHGDSLFAATSNLREWESGYRPDWMNEDEANNYGAVYRIRQAGCETARDASLSITSK